MAVSHCCLDLLMFTRRSKTECSRADPVMSHWVQSVEDTAAPFQEQPEEAPWRFAVSTDFDFHVSLLFLCCFFVSRDMDRFQFAQDFRPERQGWIALFSMFIAVVAIQEKLPEGPKKIIKSYQITALVSRCASWSPNAFQGSCCSTATSLWRHSSAAAAVLRSYTATPHNWASSTSRRVE